MEDQELHRQRLWDEHRSKGHTAFHYMGCMFLQENSNTLLLCFLVWFFFNILVAVCSHRTEHVCLLGLLVFSKSIMFTDQTTRQRPISGEVVCDLCVESEGSLKNREMSLRTALSLWHCTLQKSLSTRIKSEMCTYSTSYINLRKKTKTKNQTNKKIKTNKKPHN